MSGNEQIQDDFGVEVIEQESDKIADTGLQVEIIDDTPPEDKNRPKRTGEPDIPDDDEVSKYSEKVKKRISKLKYEFHEERRQKEEFARQQEVLIEHAKRVAAENANLKRALQSGQSIIADQMQGRVESELQGARRKLKEAVELGDIDKQIEAQSELARLTVEADKVRSFRPTEIEREEEQETYVPQAPVPKPDERTLAWARKNTWFGRDREMTDWARHIHDKLVVFEKIDPKSDEYWSELDKAMVSRYPHLSTNVDRDEDEAPAKETRRSVPVAPVKRGSTPPRKVQLTASEVSIAKRLGLTIEQYAAEKLRSM